MHPQLQNVYSLWLITMHAVKGTVWGMKYTGKYEASNLPNSTVHTKDQYRAHKLTVVCTQPNSTVHTVEQYRAHSRTVPCNTNEQ